MTEPFCEAVTKTVVKSLRDPLPGTGRPPPFALVADKATPTRSSFQNIGVMTPRPETGELHAVVLGVKPTTFSSGAGTEKELADKLGEFVTPSQINERYYIRMFRILINLLTALLDDSFDMAYSKQLDSHNGHHTFIVQLITDTNALE